MPQYVAHWQVVFHRRSGAWWTRAIPGRFKHVSLLACLAGPQVWLHYDPGATVGRMTVVPWGIPLVATWLGFDFNGCTIVEFEARDHALGRRPWLFSCVAIAHHALGLSAFTPTPDLLYRHLLKHGGKIIWPVSSEVATGGAEASICNQC